MAGRPKINLQGNKKVDANTRFHIDYDWWSRSTMDLKAYLATRLQALGIDNIHFNPEIDEVDIAADEFNAIVWVCLLVMVGGWVWDWVCSFLMIAVRCWA